MARILVGVTGGIAAYKACTARAPARPSGARRVPDRDGGRRALRRARDLLRARPQVAERGPVPAPRARRPAGDRAADRQHARAARARARGRRPDRGRACARRAARRGAGDERTHVGAPGDPGECRDAARTRRRASSGRPRGSSPRARSGRGGWPSPRRSPRPSSRSSARVPTGPLAGRRVLVSAGGTREQLDAVRFLGNRSSGRMGVAVAEEARRRGRGRDAPRREPRGSGARRRDRRRDADRRRPRARGARARGCGRDRHGRCGRRLPAGRAVDGEAPEGRRARGRSSSTPTPDVLAALGAGAHARAGARRLRGGRRGDRARASAREARARRAPTSSSSTTSAARTSASTRPRTRS